MAEAVLASGRDLLETPDPLDAELWASLVLGMFHRAPVPFQAQKELEAGIGTAIVECATAAADEGGLAVLRALAAVAPPPLGSDAHAAAQRLAEQGVPDQPWARHIGTARCVEAWSTEDPFGDQIGYYAIFRGEGYLDHLVMALYDQNLGGIIKDASAGPLRGDPRRHLQQGGLTPLPVDFAQMAGRILAGVEMGDRFIDNAWTEDFKNTRALLVARMRRLNPRSFVDPEPIDAEQREALVEAFLSSPFAPAIPEADPIADYCFDFAYPDPLRWSPIAVEAFLVDFLPRKTVLDSAEIAAVPEVLAGWIRFALSRKGLEDLWIDETVAAIDRWIPDFQKAVGNPANFGPAKAMFTTMLDEGVDPADPKAVEAWMEAFNNRPFEERDALWGEIRPLPTRFGRDKTAQRAGIGA